ncbi:hypothetical protein DBV15_12530 [Temnothorax longispinosus]|uniref:Uncharacterized protein n=1 Tax=Temnothorax longispinosus TaxID=300112 RepID=A0A4S2L7U5_9HYME|nr:hypothetical protein DBV15_12530 [Temnothorax longispinosus]
MNAIRKSSCAVPECVKKFIDVQRHFFKFPKEQDRSTSTINKKPAVRNKSSDDSPRKRKLREKFQKLKAQNKVMRETIRRLRMEKKKKATKVEEENEFDQLKKLGHKFITGKI